MFGAEAEGAGEFGLPIDEPLVGAGVDEVEADAGEDALRDGERGEPLGDVVGATEEAQRRIVERL